MAGLLGRAGEYRYMPPCLIQGFLLVFGRWRALPCIFLCRSFPSRSVPIRVGPEERWNKALQRFFETGKPRGLSVQDDKRVARILRALEAASRPVDLDLPGYRFHSLTGDQKGRYSVRVTGNWRITFGWDGENVMDIDLEGYH
jgi:proteic killer suppression protein